MIFAALVLARLPLGAAPAPGQNEAAISNQIRHLRDVPDAERGALTKRLALEIREVPAEGGHRLALAVSLSHLATEGDFGRDTLQELATTLAGALRDTPAEYRKGGGFSELAELVRYEHVDASLDLPEFRAAMAKLEADDRQRQQADFTLTDLGGKSWTLRDLRGKVVLVNFWATWCPPCRKEMPDLEALYSRFHDQGLVILAISDEDSSKVAPYIADHHFTYPVLLDPGRNVARQFIVQGIPKSFIYDREGRLAAEAIDMRTMNQFLALLDRAGMR